MQRALARLAVVALAVALALPAAAPAQQTNAPPGNSAIDEYLETIPGSAGNRRPGRSGTAALKPAQRERLERLGPDGKALADVVDATAPRPAAKPDASASAPRGAISDAQGRSPVREILAAATGADDGGGLGLVLPAILLGSLLGAIALVMLRRRSSS